MLRLSTTHDNQIRQADVPGKATDLGSAPDCGIHVPFPGVSRRHARVEPVNDGVRLVDLGSKNGLHQKGRRLYEVTLRPGDSVQLGKASLTLEEIDTSDALLTGPKRSRARTPKSERDEDTDTVATGGADSTPAEALRLLRDIEMAGVDLAGPRGRDLVDRATRVVGATSLFVVTRAGSGAALRQVHGAVPSEDHVNRAIEIVADADCQEVVSVELGDSLWLAACLLGAKPEDPVLGAILSSASRHLKPWRSDLLGYLAHRLRPTPTRRAAPARAIQNATLVLPDGFVRGRAPASIRLLDQLQAAIKSDLDVLILGETGTGKEYVARIIHDSGPTARGPLIAINCAAIPSELLEAELFGVKTRIATGVDPRPGLLTRAAGGCVFLDEIGDMPETLQAKLLRALQEREVMPIGAHQPEPIQVRVISSTNKNLTAMVRAGQFRADLYFRLRGLEFSLPSLRERVEDIAVLTLAFADRAALAHQKEVAGISRRALNLLERHDWPGNVRELRSEIERAVLLCPDGDTLSSRYFESLRPRELAVTPATAVPTARADDAGSLVQTSPPTRITPRAHDTGAKLSHRIDKVEAHAIEQALELSRGNRTVAARGLGITRNGLALKMKRLGINARD